MSAPSNYTPQKTNHGRSTRVQLGDSLDTAAAIVYRRLFFEGRDPRSPEYKAGVLAALVNRLDSPAVSLSCPHAMGTTAADAWLAGYEEGRRPHDTDRARMNNE